VVIVFAGWLTLQVGAATIETATSIDLFQGGKSGGLAVSSVSVKPGRRFPRRLVPPEPVSRQLQFGSASIGVAVLAGRGIVFNRRGEPLPIWPGIEVPAWPAAHVQFLSVPHGRMPFPRAESAKRPTVPARCPRDRGINLNSAIP